ncbi:outer membrane beta-barrel protein [Polluticaenibacter yanchengensis]|uniref:TonB-dependent receptor n=1 Tax=Polluticaenibacter yanchengensis TaxID=3014562 RepID=A0ABT4UHU5_9BACT|nr:TonB-dependent receptor [Chitinophagaceae bacterium LY-5]
MRLFLFIAAIFSCIFLSAQTQKTVDGYIADSTGFKVASATVKLRMGKDSLMQLSNDFGYFKFSTFYAGSSILEISSMGYKLAQLKFVLADSLTHFPFDTIYLRNEDSELDDVVVTSTMAVKTMEDTVQYNVSAFNYREGAPVEDVIKKIPGVEVDKDGNISSQGKKVTKIRVNGKEFFGGDLQTATQNLPADIIANIQFIEDYGEQANLTGIKSGEPETIININIKKDKNKGTFGNATVSGGSRERYGISVNGNKFKDDNQFSFLANSNNANTNAFNFSGGRGGAMSQGNNVGANGFTVSNSLGFNMRHKFNEKHVVYGSYSFSNRRNNTSTTTFAEDIDPDKIRTTNSMRESKTNSSNHRVNLNWEYQIDSSMFLKLTPYYSINTGRNNSASLSDIVRDLYYTNRESMNRGHNNGANFGTDVIFNKKFGHNGRNLNTVLSFTQNNSNNDGTNYNHYINIDSTYIPPAIQDTIQNLLSEGLNNSIKKEAKLSYVEPLFSKAGANAMLELRYEYSNTVNNNDKEVFNVLNNGQLEMNQNQTNYFDYNFTTNRIGMNLKGQQGNFNYVVGYLAQPVSMEGINISKNTEVRYSNNVWLPNARFVYKFNKNSTLTANYDARSTQPTYNQLQPIADSSNLNNVVIGNAELSPERNQTLDLRYSFNNRKTGANYFANFTTNIINDKVVVNRLNNTSGTGRTTTYLNADGFYRLTFNTGVSIPLHNKMFNLRFGINTTYDNNISYTDNFKNKGENWNIRPNAMFRLDIQDVVDLSLSGSYTYYNTLTRFQTYNQNNIARTTQLSLNGKNYFFKDFTLGYQLSKVYNTGFGVSRNPFIINVYAEYRFMNKNANVRLQAFDLLDENTGISRTVSATTITDSQSNRLAQYFMLSFNYRLQKFGGKAASGGNNRGNRG